MASNTTSDMQMSKPAPQSRPLTPEQKRAMKVLVNALYVSDRYMVNSIPKDRMLPTDYIAFSHRPIKKHMVWCDEWWSWNQSNAKSYANIDRDTFVTIRKLNPRKNRGVAPNLKKPAYKIWIFHVEFTAGPPCWCLWCERGIANEAVPATFHLPIHVPTSGAPDQKPQEAACPDPSILAGTFFSASKPQSQQWCGTASSSGVAGAQDAMDWSATLSGWETYFATMPSGPAQEFLLDALEQRESCLTSLFKDDVEMLLWADE
eukprot:CAMPEP_0114620064 /NCGR_PEP_ID=MMETSP0168-20121206/8528_1 /TAXON_ID=95228 ORGANISM="Vannella sp., Strain DIVA3 517/6/12" /NCGR_SAMPLE_ID=MMETSP0168 /ASSEMBLY_ACC=CAM_ASM_000044 /LENGTH=260 /DNA_ID=CAMNT_0001831235 /DNA_START=75 /DNA_END=857 /DNA_ORIENTATION=-